MAPRLLLIDASSSIFRAFYALPPFANSLGVPTNATLGFTTMLQKVLRDSELGLNTLIDLKVTGHAELDGKTVMVRELQVMDQTASDLRVDCLLTGASLYTTRGQFTAAMGNVNQVLAMDPDNRQAQAMRGRIEVAANSGWGW